LLLAAEWKPITILMNENGKLNPLPLKDSGLEYSHGWWNHLQVADFDKDGDLDIVAGNLGLNTTLRTSRNEPVRMYVSDFDDNSSLEQVLTHFINGNEYPYYTRDEMVKQLPGLKKKYLSYSKFAEATINDVFKKETLEKAKLFEAYVFQSSYIENKGNGKFQLSSLPSTVQFSTVNASAAGDFNDDGNLDIILAGNFYPLNIQMGRYDASYGNLLVGDGRGGFKVISNKDAGIYIRGEVRSIKKIKVGDKIHYLGFRNNDSIESFTLKK
jgi:hypothetical protein